FLGQAFTEVFAAIGAEVIAIDRWALAAEMKAPRPKVHRNVENVDHDVTQPLPIHGRIDFILSLAAIASPVHYARRPLDCFDVIVKGTRNMLELAGLKGARMLLSSTSELYGDMRSGTVEMSEHQLGVLDPWNVRGRAYDVPKLASEALSSIFAERGVDVRTVRYFNIYGPGLSRHDYRVMSKFAAAVVDGVSIPVHGYVVQGFGHVPTRSFCYITDAIVGTLLVLTSPEKRPVNVGNPDEVSMHSLADTFAAVGHEMTRKAQRIEHVDSPPEYTQQPQRRLPNIDRLRGLGFESKVPLREGVRRMLAWAIEAYAQEAQKK
ncbi:MAG: NAD-dependent epimerase/dehydratase family protein, partial [Acidobacteriota bacterium]|nr:NAD-dependent epimerase/dehydratase family protein [Acidobacteriota bacterium]